MPTSRVWELTLGGVFVAVLMFAVLNSTALGRVPFASVESRERDAKLSQLL
jgi:hypothetical protein